MLWTSSKLERCSYKLEKLILKTYTITTSAKMYGIFYSLWTALLNDRTNICKKKHLCARNLVCLPPPTPSVALMKYIFLTGFSPLTALNNHSYTVINHSIKNKHITQFPIKNFLGVTLLFSLLTITFLKKKILIFWLKIKYIKRKYPRPAGF